MFAWRSPLHLGTLRSRCLPTKAELTSAVVQLRYQRPRVSRLIPFDAHASSMASAGIPRALSNTIRQIGRSRPGIYGEAFKRAASTKHPKNFSPPSSEELTELRERVQDFTRGDYPSRVSTTISLILLSKQDERSPKKSLRKPTWTMHSRTICGGSLERLGTLHPRTTMMIS